MLLKGLERSLRNMRHEWDMQFVLGGPEALEAMDNAPFDVVISDMRMPGMDGAELLDLVRRRFSQTVRMVLSGQSDKEAVLRAVRPTHQYLSKPCDIEELKHKLKSALALRNVLDSSELKRTVSQIETVPSLPSMSGALQRQLKAEQPDLAEIAEIVSRDPGITAKLLQLLNSAFLGAASRLSSPKQAVSIIGVENLCSLMSCGVLFSDLLPSLTGKLAPVWSHAHATARYAEAIARCEHVPNSVAESCYTAGLLHEIGWIILAASYGDRFEKIVCAMDRSLPAADREREAFGSSVGSVGAYLLGLWGLPDPIIEATAGCRELAQLKPEGFCPLVAVHVADNLHRQWYGPYFFCEDDFLDRDLLGQLGLLDRLPVWEKQCREIPA